MKAVSRSFSHGETAIYKGDILQINVGATLELREEFASAVDVCEADIAHIAATGKLRLRYRDSNGMAAGAVDEQVLEREPLDARDIFTEVAAGAVFGQFDRDAVTRVGDNEIGKNTVSDRAVPDPTNADGLAMGAERATFDDDVFAGDIFRERVGVGAHDEGIVPRVDGAIGNEDVMGAVDMDAVGIGVVGTAIYLQGAHVNIGRAVDPNAPTACELGQGKIL